MKKNQRYEERCIDNQNIQPSDKYDELNEVTCLINKKLVSPQFSAWSSSLESGTGRGENQTERGGHPELKTQKSDFGEIEAAAICEMEYQREENQLLVERTPQIPLSP